MDDEKQTPEDRLPSTFVPATNFAMRCFAEEAFAQKLAYQIAAIMNELGRDIDLSNMDGVTVAHDYDQALLELDRGYEATIQLTPSSGDTIGIAMTPSVIRDGKLKSHIVFNAALVEHIVDSESEWFMSAAHIIAHECAHVEVTARFDEAFPNVLLRTKLESRLDIYRSQVIMAVWDEYAATWISAGYGEDPTPNYEVNLKLFLEKAREQANDSIKAYRDHGEHGQVMDEVFGFYGDLLKYSAYLLGTMRGRRLTVADLLDTKSALEGHWFAPYFDKLSKICGLIADDYGKWETIAPFEAIGDLLEEIVRNGGVYVTRGTGGGVHLKVPFTPDTMPGIVTEAECAMWNAINQL